MGSTPVYHNLEKCAICENDVLQEIISFGETAISDALLTEEDLHKLELKVPLTLMFCPKCSLLQIKEVVNAELLFCRDYPYYSSVNPTLVDHFAHSAKAIIDRFDLNAGSVVLEAACNDGVLLQHFVSKGIPAIGVDPAARQVELAREMGIDARCAFFNKEFAEQLLEEEGAQVDVFMANNVLAHVDQLMSFIEGINILLKPSGTAIIEVPYVKQTIDRNEFDQIFHQHLRYFSLHALKYAFGTKGLFVNDVEQINIHGGSLRLFVGKVNEPSPSVNELLEIEKEVGQNVEGYYRDFAIRIEELKTKMIDLLDKLKQQNKRIVGYGAAGKANTLMHYFGIDKHYLDYIGDISPYKQGKYFTGNHLRIVSPEYLIKDHPDYVLILAWNFADAIMEQFRPALGNRVKFIIPIPEPVVV